MRTQFLQAMCHIIDTTLEYQKQMPVMRSIATDEDRTFFRITIPCHEAAGDIIADIAH